MKVKDLLKTSKNWTKGAIARDRKGVETYASCSTAVKWCLVGAIIKCYSWESQVEIFKKITDFTSVGNVISDWNDDRNRKFKDVKELVNKLDI